MERDRAAGDPQERLREDVKRLGGILGQTLADQSGSELLRLVEAARRESKAARSGDDEARAALRSRLMALPIAQAVPVSRAFAHFLMLANIAEQHHRVRRRRDHERDAASGPQQGSLEEALPRLVRSGVPPRQLHKMVQRMQIEAVLTAHPTEVARRTLIAKQQRVAHLLAELDRTDLTPGEHAGHLDSLAREVASMWRTREVRVSRPTPEAEARGAFALVEQVLWDAVPAFLRRLDQVLIQTTGKGLPLGVSPVRFASWMGGDRDGNPNVTHSVTERVVLLARWKAAELALREVEALRDELSVGNATRDVRREVGEHPEPYRELLRGPRDLLRGTLLRLEARLEGRPEPDVPHYEATADLVATLRLAYDSLHATGGSILASGRLLDLLRRMDTFGLSLLRLDVRQDGDRHGLALAALARTLGVDGYLDREELARMALLRSFLSIPSGELGAAFTRTLESVTDPHVRETLLTFQTLSRLPRESLSSYVVSMTHDASDLLEVLVLERAAGITLPLPVVPLFETARDLQQAPRILDAALRVPGFRSAAGDAAEVMIGYSDSAKEVGLLAASWAIYTAQENLLAVGRRHQVGVRLFHGRGGSVGRGGGPAHAAILALPVGAVENGLRVTEQGEMIQARYGLPGIAQRTLELYATATLEAQLRPMPPPPAAWRSLMDRMAATARAAYEAVVNAPGFVDYFEAATPIAFLDRMNIGSRPARRPTAAARGIAGLRAIPWVFAWTQNRLILPGWLGMGEALASARREHARLLDEMLSAWPFLRSTVDMVEMVLAKADLSVAREYHERFVPSALWPVGEDLFERYEATVREVLAATGHDELLDGNPVLKRSIAVRNPYVDPINLLQVELLRRERLEPDPRLADALLVTVGGIAQGMRNTG